MPMPDVDTTDLDAELAAERAHLDRVPRRAAPDAGTRRGTVRHRRQVAGDAYSAETLGRHAVPPGRRARRRPDHAAVLRPARTSPATIARAAYHIGRRHVTDDAGEPMVLDWRAPLSRTFYRASVARPAGRRDPAPVRVRQSGELTSFEDEHLDRGEELGTSSRDPDRRDRAAARRADARHRRHHPARAGRAGPRRAGRDDLRAGRARHRQDRGRPAPGRVPALPAPGAAAPLRRADRRAEPRRSCATSRRCCRPSARSRCEQATVDELIARVPVRGSRRAGGGRAQARRADGRGAAPGAVAAGSPSRPSRSWCRTARSGGGSIAEPLRRIVDEARREGLPYAVGRERVRARVVGAAAAPGGGPHAATRRGEAWLRRMGKVAPVTGLPRPRLARGDPGGAGRPMLLTDAGSPRGGRRAHRRTSRPRCAGPSRLGRSRRRSGQRRRPGADRRGGRADRAAAELRPRGGGRGAGPLARCSAGRSPGAASTARSPLLGDLAQGTAPWAAARLARHPAPPRQAGRRGGAADHRLPGAGRGASRWPTGCCRRWTWTYPAAVSLRRDGDLLDRAGRPPTWTPRRWSR